MTDHEPPLDSGVPSARAPESATPDDAIDQMLHHRAPSPWRRIVLTYQHLGLRTLLYRAATFPLRFTPLRKRLRLGKVATADQAHAVAWYRGDGRKVTIVIPTYGPPDDLIEAVRSIRKTTPEGKVEIVVADDGSASEHVERLKQIADVRLVLGEANVGFAANANRGIAAADPRDDIVLLNSDVVALPDWLACLQFAAYSSEDIGIVGAKLLYPDGRIQHAGVHRNLGAPRWFDHRFRFKPADYGPANITSPALAVTGACMYVRREVIDRIGVLDERYPMAYEDVDWCLRAWQAGFRVMYYAPATLQHRESVTRGTVVGEREQASQDAFWARWWSRSARCAPRAARCGSST
jgi:GT2 family glycosyltransferase